jgi:single-strand DNA-binding protein
VVFGKGAEFAEKYLKQGTKIAVTGRIQTGSYTNRDGIKVYTTDVVIEEQEFAESKNAGGNAGNQYIPNGAVNQPSAGNLEFMNIPEGIENDLPFK